MQSGETFAEIVAETRKEAGRSTEPGHGIGDADRVKRAVNKALIKLYDDYAWPHLRRVFDRVTMAAGQRFYDPPDGLDIERIEKVDVWWNGNPSELNRGIGTHEYATFDSIGDERNDPVLRYDVRYHDTPSNATMIEVWPVPATTLTALEFTGTYQVRRLVNDSDICLLDAEAVTLMAASYLLKGDDAKTARADAMERVFQMRRRFPDTAPVRMGLGHKDRIPAGRAVVRVS